MSNFEKDNKIYVFLSHSHYDYEKVRVVRDLLEEEGFRPLMFFLKCLEKDEYNELTHTLIKEEIDSRQRFILCRSKNADNSKWVQFEVNHIKKLQRPYETVDLDASIDVQKQVLLRFKRRSTVFISYPRTQQQLAVLVEQELKKNDFKPFIDIENIYTGHDYVKEITGAIIKASKEGYILAFLDGKISPWTYREIGCAIEKKGHVIPVVLSDAGLIELQKLQDLQVSFPFHSIDVRDAISERINTAQIIVEKLIQIDLNLNQ